MVTTGPTTPLELSMRRPLLCTAAAVALTLPTAAPALAHEGEEQGRVLTAVADTGTATGGVTHVANRQYAPTGAASQSGSDLEFVSTGGKDYVVAGTLRNGLQVIDVTDPTSPREAAVYDCRITQGDVQVFRQGARILATYTADSSLGAANTSSRCAQDLNLAAGWLGTVIVDLTDPTNPTSVGAVQISTGSHNMTVHPSGNYLYNSNSDLITDTTPQIEIVDIHDPANPVRLPDFAFPVNPSSLGSNSHDISFNASGTRAYSAALSSTLILDTTDPAAPTLLTQIENPRINVEHDVKWLPLTRPDGSTRELLLVGDEIAGAVGNGSCPGGGVTVFDVTGPLETSPKDLGTWFIDDLTGTVDNGNGAGAGGSTRCTAHVFQLYPEQGLMTIGWYQRGVRVLDISGLATYDAAVPVPAVFGSGIGITEVGSYFFEDSDTWSFKTNRIATDGSFFGYGNDVNRGFDVYRFAGFGDGRRCPPFAVRGRPVEAPTPVVPEVAPDGAAAGHRAAARRRH